jgi:hypothetical protein
LIVFGVLTCIAAACSPFSDGAKVAVLFFLAPLGFLLVALIYRRREISLGIGGRPRGYLLAALVVVLVVPVLGLLLGAYALIGCALLVIAVLQRNLILATWGVVFAVVGALEQIGFFSNRLYSLADVLGINRSSSGYFSWSSELTYGMLGLALIVGGLVARRHERFNA